MIAVRRYNIITLVPRTLVHAYARAFLHYCMTALLHYHVFALLLYCIFAEFKYYIRLHHYTICFALSHVQYYIIALVLFH